MRRLLLGTWHLPSGNSVDAVLEVSPGDSPHYEPRCEWDRFPISRDDADYYSRHIAPEVYKKYAALPTRGRSQTKPGNSWNGQPSTYVCKTPPVTARRRAKCTLCDI
jgi:hypothetical protein